MYNKVNDLDALADGNVEKVTSGSILGQAMLGSEIQEMITVQIRNNEYSYKVLDIEKDETDEGEEISINITNDSFLGFWEDYQIRQGNLGLANGFIVETPLHTTGYSIWDGSRRRTRTERWNILINSSIPKIGIEEVVSTIQSHIRNRFNNPNAIIEWQFDLDRLKNIYYRKDKIDYFAE